MVGVISLFLCGVALSAFFSGSETGLYRVSRTRLVLDALSGSRLSRGLVWLLNHPSIFVATALVGNNLANYLTSLSTVMAVLLWFGHNPTAELLGPILLTPVVFVFGELLPKYLYFHSPYRLIHATRPLLIGAAILFSPVTIMLGWLERGLQRLTGQTPFRLRLSMARSELDQVLRHGLEAGVLAAGQRSLAQGLFEVGNRRAISFGVQAEKLATIDTVDPDGEIDASRAQHQARRKNQSIVLVRDRGRIVGHLSYIDLCLGEAGGQAASTVVQPVLTGRVSDRHLATLLRMYDSGCEVMVLNDVTGQPQSVVTRRQLLQPLIKRAG